MSKCNEWHKRLSVAVTDNKLIGHAGAVLLRRPARGWAGKHKS